MCLILSLYSYNASYRLSAAPPGYPNTVSTPCSSKISATSCDPVTLIFSSLVIFFSCATTHYIWFPQKINMFFAKFVQNTKEFQKSGLLNTKRWKICILSALRCEGGIQWRCKGQCRVRTRAFMEMQRAVASVQPGRLHGCGLLAAGWR